MSSDYRLSPALAARLVGVLTIGLALLVFLATGLVAALNLHTVVLVPVALVGLAALLGVGAWLRRTPVVHLDDAGYRVRLVRGAGVTQARWSQVVEVATTTREGSPCVLLRLEGGRTTTIPVDALAADREDFVRDLAGHLPRGQVPPATGRP